MIVVLLGYTHPYWAKDSSQMKHLPTYKTLANLVTGFNVDSKNRACLVQCFASKCPVSAKTSYITGYQYYVEQPV